ncbi:predicted protein [Chaetoceros tenuissimus]|uniref:Uncharacterized protein n=1 Tax=Chaetoceros tenuissimus TaxID=426638 RepID=A0AAD3CF40_9STRA|nr:predicted protein [Chaetoceros tenuissimus]
MMNPMKLFTTLVLLKINWTSAFLTPSRSIALSSIQFERTFVPLAAQTYAEIEAAAEKAVEWSAECSIDYRSLEQAVEYEVEKMAECEAIVTSVETISSPKINVFKIQEEQRKELKRQKAILKEQQDAEKREAQARAEAEAMRMVQEAQASIAKDIISHSENTNKKKKRFDIPRAAVSDPTEKEEKIETEEEIPVKEMGPETLRMHGLKSSGKLVRNVLEEIALPTEYYNEEFLLDDEMPDEISLL